MIGKTACTLSFDIPYFLISLFAEKALKSANAIFIHPFQK
jgi:hypothetical protein